MRRVRRIGKREERGNGEVGVRENNEGTAVASEAVSMVGKELHEEDSRLKEEQKEDAEDDGEEHEEWEEVEMRAGLASARLKLLILGEDIYIGPNTLWQRWKNQMQEERNTHIGHMLQAVEKRNSGVRAWKKALSLQGERKTEEGGTDRARGRGGRASVFRKRMSGAVYLKGSLPKRDEEKRKEASPRYF